MPARWMRSLARSMVTASLRRTLIPISSRPGTIRIVSLAAVVSGQHAQVVIEPLEQHNDALHCSPASIDVQIAELKDGEAVKGGRQSAERDAVMPELDAGGVADAPPIEARRHQGRADQGVRQGQVLDVKEVQPLAEDLRFVILLDAETLPCLAPPKTLLQH